MTDEPTHIATAAAALDDPYAALSKRLHGDGDAPPLRITYRNWRGEVSERNIVPQSVWFGATEWHPEPQWLLSALDTDKGAARDFALADFGANDDTWRTRAMAAEAEVGRLRGALEWYGEQARLCRLAHSGGDAGRHALQADGGKRARSVLTQDDTCTTPGCTNPPVIRLKDRRLCQRCYATHDFGENE